MKHVPLGLTALLVAVACARESDPPLRSRDASVDERAFAGPDARGPEDSAASDGSVRAMARATDFVPAAVLRALSGPVMTDTTERARLDDGAGGQIRPGSDPVRVGPAAMGLGLFPGDRVETGENGRVTMDFGGGAVVTLGPNARAIVPAFGGTRLILSRGVALLIASGSGDALVLDAPSARVEASNNGRAYVAVADDGSTLVASIEGTMRVHPTPEAPRRAILGPRMVRAPRHGHHPISLDVAVQEIDWNLARPLALVQLAQGRALSWDAAGRARPPALGAPSDGSIAAWRTRVERDVLRPNGHHVPIANMARAGSGDLADARTLSAQLGALGARARDALARLVPGAASVGDVVHEVDEAARERAELELRLSAALGRASARADRARSLATRGGDVTSLVALARLEEVIEAARPVLPALPSEHRPRPATR